MLYPKCPKCGGKSKAADTMESKETAMGLRGGHYVGRGHPLIALGVMIATVGVAIYKRVPGGGDKECTGCGHRFN